MARHDLHLSEDEFWGLTYRQYDALIKRLDFHKRHRELLAGINTAATVNHSSVYKAMLQTDHQPKMTKPEDFMPSEWAKKAESPKAQSQRMTKKRRKQVADGIRAMFMPARMGKQKG